MASQLEELAIMYSDSIELSAIETCFLLNDKTTHEPKQTENPEALLLSLALPTQLNLQTHTSSNIHLQNTLKYWKRSFATTQ